MKMLLSISKRGKYILKENGIVRNEANVGYCSCDIGDIKHFSRIVLNDYESYEVSLEFMSILNSLYIRRKKYFKKEFENLKIIRGVE